jgi:flavin-dependent dehydrogenase
MRAAFDAIVIGAGPAGSSAAILLAQAGWSVALVEKQEFPRRKVCGECIAASNLPLLAALGLTAALDQHAGAELRRVAFMCGLETIVADMPASLHHPYRWGRALGRETLDTALLEQARAVGVHVLQPWSVQTIDGTPGAWRCDIRATDTQSLQTLHAPIAIAAHGSWERLPPDRSHRALPRRSGDLLAFKANFLGASLSEGLLPVMAFEGGYGGMVVAGNGVMTVAGCVRRDRLRGLRLAAPGLSAGDSFEAMLQRECGGVKQVLAKASRYGPWLAAGPLNPGIRLHTHDGVFRIGNAAGEAHPIIGEGMSMAFQSAWLLCARLLCVEQGDGDRAIGSARWQKRVQSRYARDWHRQFAPRLRLASTFAHTSMHPSIATLFVTLLRGWPGLLTLGAKWSGKTRCSIDTTTISLLAQKRVPKPM